MGIRIKKRREVNPLKIILTLAVLLFVLWFSLWLYAATIKVIKNVAQNEMEDIANDAIHLAVRDACTNGGDYAELVNIYRNSEGKIESLTLNTQKVNKLKSEIALNTLKYLNAKERAEISIPIGHFLGTEFLTGIGPEMKFKIIPCNIANIDFESTFSEAGINQVRHSIKVRVDVNIGALLPRFEDMTNLSSSALVTEAVIIGDVPDTYLNVGGNTNDR